MRVVERIAVAESDMLFEEHQSAKNSNLEEKSETERTL